MKQAFASFLALALIFVAGLNTSKANGIASAKTFTVSVQGFADVVSPGDSLDGTLTIQTKATLPPTRSQFNFEIFISTPLGDAPVQTGSFTLRSGVTRTVKVSIPVDENAAPGTYTLTVIFASGGQTASVSHEFTVR